MCCMKIFLQSSTFSECCMWALFTRRIVFYMCIGFLLGGETYLFLRNVRYFDVNIWKIECPIFYINFINTFTNVCVSKYVWLSLMAGIDLFSIPDSYCALFMLVIINIGFCPLLWSVNKIICKVARFVFTGFEKWGWSEAAKECIECAGTSYRTWRRWWSWLWYL